MNQSPNRRRALWLLTTAALLICGAPSARANAISFLDAYRNLSNTQTGNGNTLSSAGAFYSADLNSTSANAYTSVSMSYPGSGSPVSLPEVSPPSTDYHYQTATLATQAAMDAAFPFGTYTFTTNTADTANFAYAGDDYPQSLPFLTGTDYSSLQGMNPANAFVFHFSPYTTGSTADYSFMFFTIFDYTLNAFVFNAGFLPSTTPSVTVSANTLNFGDSFAYEIDFSNRDLVSGTGGAFAPQLGFDVRTTGTFTAEARQAVPEPSTAALCGIGLLALVMFYRRRNGGRFATIRRLNQIRPYGFE
jgi:hypothetical protein